MINRFFSASKNFVFAFFRYLGFLHLWFKRQPPPALLVDAASGRKTSVSDPISPVVEKPQQAMPSIHSKDEILLILDQMLLFDDSSTFQGILGLVHHLQWANLELKLEVLRASFEKLQKINFKDLNF